MQNYKKQVQNGIVIYLQEDMEIYEGEHRIFVDYSFWSRIKIYRLL
jgi:hypothetical protein